MHQLYLLSTGILLIKKPFQNQKKWSAEWNRLMFLVFIFPYLREWENLDANLKIIKNTFIIEKNLK